MVKLYVQPKEVLYLPFSAWVHIVYMEEPARGRDKKKAKVGDSAYIHIPCGFADQAKGVAENIVKAMKQNNFHAFEKSLKRLFGRIARLTLPLSWVLCEILSPASADDGTQIASVDLRCLSGQFFCISLCNFMLVRCSLLPAAPCDSHFGQCSYFVPGIQKFWKEGVAQTNERLQVKRGLCL